MKTTFAFIPLFIAILCGCFAPQPIMTPIINGRYDNHIGKGETKIEEAANYLLTVNSAGKYIKRTFFYPTNKLVSIESYFSRKMDLLDGVSERWWDNGAMRDSGSYSMGQRDGMAKQYHIDGKLQSYGEYKMGTKMGEWTYISSIDGTLRKSNYDTKKYIDTDTLGLVIDKGTFEPEYESEMNVVEETYPIFNTTECTQTNLEEKKKCPDQKMISKVQMSIRFPAEAREAGIQGTTFTHFVVDENGDIINVECISCLCQSLKFEVEKAVKSLSNFKPATRNGKPVKAIIILPIRFRLQ